MTKIDADCLSRTKPTLAKTAERNPWQEQSQQAPEAAQQAREILQKASFSVLARRVSGMKVTAGEGKAKDESWDFCF